MCGKFQNFVRNVQQSTIDCAEISCNFTQNSVSSLWIPADMSSYLKLSKLCNMYKGFFLYFFSWGHHLEDDKDNDGWGGIGTNFIAPEDQV